MRLVDLDNPKIFKMGRDKFGNCIYHIPPDTPTVQLERNKGKWIKNNDSDHVWKCSVCGYGYTDYKLSYCYDCGAEMKGEEDE